MAKQPDARPPLQRALGTAAGLKPGTWESVEALAVLALAAGEPEATSLRDTAHRTAATLKPGSWESVRALAWLARADRSTVGADLP